MKGVERSIDILLSLLKHFIVKKSFYFIIFTLQDHFNHFKSSPFVRHLNFL